MDRLLSLEPGKEGVGEYLVRGDEPWLRGHLPGEPLLPGVLLIEAAAQLAGVVAQNDPVIPPMPGLKLTALRNVKILGSARPGETVRLEARITGRLGVLVQAEVSAFVSATKVLSAELTLSGTAGTWRAGLGLSRLGDARGYWLRGRRKTRRRESNATTSQPSLASLFAIHARQNSSSCISFGVRLPESSYTCRISDLLGRLTQTLSFPSHLIIANSERCAGGFLLSRAEEGSAPARPRAL